MEVFVKQVLGPDAGTPDPVPFHFPRQGSRVQSRLTATRGLIPRRGAAPLTHRQLGPGGGLYSADVSRYSDVHLSADSPSGRPSFDGSHQFA